tara:strand:+ start:4872 stop:5219 length:348 start_codon:yes stop_codon:yes gene_type:complete
VIKKLINLFSKKPKSSLPDLSKDSVKKNIFGFKKKQPPILELIQQLVIDKVDFNDLENSLSEEDWQQLLILKKDFNKAVKTAGMHKGNKAARNKSKIINFVTFLVEKNYLIKIKK